MYVQILLKKTLQVIYCQKHFKRSTLCDNFIYPWIEVLRQQVKIVFVAMPQTQLKKIIGKLLFSFSISVFLKHISVLSVIKIEVTGID